MRFLDDNPLLILAIPCMLFGIIGLPVIMISMFGWWGLLWTVIMASATAVLIRFG